MSKRRLTLDDIVEIGFKEFPTSLEEEADTLEELLDVNEVRCAFIFGYIAGYGLKVKRESVYEAVDRYTLKNVKL